MNKRFLRVICYILTVVLFLIGLGIFVYPLISGNTANTNQKIVVENFENRRKTVVEETEQQSSKETDEVSAGEEESGNDKENNNMPYKQLYEEMKRYNDNIYKDGQAGLCDAWIYEQASVNLSAYGFSDEPVAVLRVPKMNNLEMPVYLGASYNNMARGAAQLGQTSMPIGGKNTNCVLAGHRGWSGAEYFLNIEQLEIGDDVYIDNLWETLSYKVCEIKVIYPSDIDSILIRKNEDMVTLITCHPYWASTYRYAVFCRRVDDSKLTDEGESRADSVNSDPETQTVSDSSDEAEKEVVISTQDAGISERIIMLEKISYVAVPVLLIVLLALLIPKRKAKNKI